MWTNQLGGKLYYRLLHDLNDDHGTLTEETVLFKASQKKFFKFGKTELEHRIWRQRELKLLRLTYLRHLTWNVNREHPMFATDEALGKDADQPETSLPLNEPNITLEELDKEVTDWYLRSESATSFKVPEDIKAAKTSGQPDSVIFMNWKYQTTEAETKKRKDPQKSEYATGCTGTSPEPEAWRIVKEEELEGQELDGNEVSNIIYEWLLALGGGNTRHNTKTITNAIQEAQVDSSDATRNKGFNLPIRLRKHSSYYLDSFAITSIAPRGRPSEGAKRGSTYKLIRGSAPIRAQSEQKPNQTSCEPPQE